MEERRFRLMTANLLNGRAEAGDLRRVIDLVEPDLVATQELGPDAAEVLADRFPHHELRPELDHRGHGIASRLPAGFGEIPLPWRPGLWARLEIGSRRAVFASVHMRNAVTPPWWRSVRIRARQLEALFEWVERVVEEDEVFVLAGDMNASPAWPVYRRLAERWDDLVFDFAEESGSRAEPTWGWRPGWPRVLRIDHVFGRGARVVGSRVEPVRGSDHAAVVVDLQLTGIG
jgi:endonuclease/exonuclease/phosphatase family metal-dependent hydrolase